MNQQSWYTQFILFLLQRCMYITVQRRKKNIYTILNISKTKTWWIKPSSQCNEYINKVFLNGASSLLFIDRKRGVYCIQVQLWNLPRNGRDGLFIIILRITLSFIRLINSCCFVWLLHTSSFDLLHCTYILIYFTI